MTPFDVIGIIIIILLFLAYMIALPMIENRGKKGKGGNQFKILDDISRRIKNMVRWMNRQ